MEEEFVDFTLIEHYSNLYSKCLIKFAERAVKRMKDDNGSIIFISSPGCNITQTVTKGYDMPGMILIKVFARWNSEKPFENMILFLKDLENLLENLLFGIMLRICNQEESTLTLSFLVLWIQEHGMGKFIK